jgi:uncharacterized membrane protein HdeD (DUF308 family)
MKNWKTTSAGITLIVTGVISFYFAFKSTSLNEATITGVLTAVLGGIGLIFGADSEVK